MKNSEASTQDTERFQLPEKIKKELRETLVNLKIILKDNLNFFHELVKKCTSVGTNYIYDREVTQMIEKEYPDLYKYESGIELLQKSHDLVRLVCLNTSDIKAFIQEMNIGAPLALRCDIQDEIVNILGNITNED